MKKQFYLFGLLVFPCFIQAQNVGIGTPTPLARLQINHHSSTSVGLALVDSADNFSGRMEFRNNNNTRRMMISGFAASNFSNGQYLDIHSDSVYPATFKGNGNVGIRNLDPQYTLDVGGDINTTGAIRTNGNGGTSGQVLQNNGNGTMSWMDMCEFKNIAIFKTVGAGNWTVPAGVTLIMVEAWGAGAGGSAYAGGGGGGYICGFFTVSPSFVVNFSIGDGGVGAFINATNGQSTTATGPSSTLTAVGGSGPTYTAAAVFVLPGFGGNYSISPVSFLNYFGIAGQTGSIGINTFIQSGASIFREIVSSANGGDAGNSINTGGAGAYYMYNITTATDVRRASGGNANQPGGGGSGGYALTTNPALSLSGGSGGDGMVIIHY
jgi:hypothetical protein